MRERSALLVMMVSCACLLASSAQAATRVWGFWGLGDNFWNTSAGIEQIAEAARHTRGVASVRTMPYWATQEAATEINAAPAGTRIVIYGYSCGANGVTVIPYGVHRHVDVAGIQASIWCGGWPISANVGHAWQVYSGCIPTLGFGCKRYQLATGNTRTHLESVHRTRLHLFADLDRDAQADILQIIAGTARSHARAGREIEISREPGQRL